jgi:hypothetical protein
VLQVVVVVVVMLLLLLLLWGSSLLLVLLRLLRQLLLHGQLVQPLHLLLLRRCCALAYLRLHQQPAVTGATKL